jgi:tRNA-Thr(GGU) m(6)t(6)A37 methyltransferase TsaA
MAPFAHPPEGNLGCAAPKRRRSRGYREAMFEPIRMHPVGVVRSPRSEPIDDDWGELEATIELDRARFGPESLSGLEQFSHVELVYLFHMVEDGSHQTSARRPRGNPLWPAIGIFAQRAKRRPNRIGVTCCELVKIDGASLTVRGLDAIDGTPVLDLKPYMNEFAPRGEIRQPQWSHELMAGYW